MNPRTALFWSVRREIWENRSLYLAPLAVAGLILVAFAIGLAGGWSHLSNGSPSYFFRGGNFQVALDFSALLLMLTTALVGVVYCLDSLYGERRDRSILFWKSLPVSDVTTVLAKASIPLVVLPLVTFVITVVTHVLMIAMASVRMMGSGASAFSEPFWQPTMGLFSHLLLGHGLWWAPIWGWLLFCSAWARRLPLLWATLPLLALGLVERIALNTSYFANWLTYRFSGSLPGAPTAADPMAAMTPAPVDLFTSPSWAGLALFAVFVAAAVQLRRNRGPI